MIILWKDYFEFDLIYIELGVKYEDTQMMPDKQLDIWLLIYQLKDKTWWIIWEELLTKVLGVKEII
jgi:hypothetical protein